MTAVIYKIAAEGLWREAIEKGSFSGSPVDVLTGFLSTDGRAHGRPVGVTLDTRGALLVADDVGNVVWRVSSRR